MQKQSSSKIIQSYASLKYLSGNLSDSEKETDESISGLQAIFSHPSFSNRTSSVYVNEIKNYLDQDLPAAIRQLLTEPDPNMLYSLNCSSLWLLLRQKIKKLSQFSLFESISDKIVFKYCLIFGSLSALNDAKEKIVQVQRKKLRLNIKQYLENKVKQESRRTQAIASQIQKSSLFDKAIASSKNLDESSIIPLRNSLFKLKFNQKSTIIFLQKMLIYMPKVIHAHEKQIQEKGHSKIKSINQVEGPYREACNAILLCNYLNVYLCFRDWVNNLMLHPQVEQLLFANLVKQKGAHIIHRVLDDAPIDTVLKQINLLQEAYAPKK